MNLAPPGAAVLVAGYRALGDLGRTSPISHTLGQIGETLLAGAPSFRIRRLSPAAAEPHTPTRANLRRSIGELAEEPVGVALLVMAGTVTNVNGEPALVAGSRYSDFPEDASLSLSWIRDRLGPCRAERLLVVLSAEGDGGARAWLAALATKRAAQVIAVHASGSGDPVIAALLAGLRGDALDPGTGMITLRSMGDHLVRLVPAVAIQPSTASEPIAHPLPLRGLALGLSHTMDDLRSVALSPATEPSDDLLHVILPGRFRIEAILARGGFGVVYRARQLMVERDVAIKVLQAGIDPSSKDGRLFVHEIQSIGRLEHPNVVRIYHADIAPDGRLFFAMELLVGRDLQQTIEEEGKLPRARAVALTRQLLAGLGAAHDANLVHADVKPANAFVVLDRGQERLVLLDFGMARLRHAGEAAVSAGGTPAYMAPEQLNDGRVDARSDVFAAALVLVTMLTGWRRMRAEELVPPLDDIVDDELREVLARALAIDPADRYQSAGELADALAGKAPAAAPSVIPRPPFRHLASLTEEDRGRLHGRDREIAALVEHVLYERAVIYTSPSGSGKTSLLRAGLVPRLESLGARAVYLSCRAGAAEALPPAIWPGATSVAEAIHAWHEERAGKLVVILDQLELVLPDAPREDGPSGEGTTRGLVEEVLAFDRWPSDADVTVVLVVREDFLARLIGSSQRLQPAIPVLRLGPLGPDGAREAIVAPLAEARLGIAGDLLDVLIADLLSAARAIGPEMGWGRGPAVYPPHLQLACSVLYEALAPSEAGITLAHYRRLGGLDAIVGEYLERVLETELDTDSAALARDLFLALVTSANTRAMRTEADLLDLVGGRHGAERVMAVLEVLHARGLIVRLWATGGEPGWEIIHDSLVPRVLGWIDNRDLVRRRAIELIRHHLRRSRPGVPSLLNRAELREVQPYPEAVDELEAEWARRRGAESLTPAALVGASRHAFRRRAWMFAGAGAVLLGIAGIAVREWASDRARRQREQALLAGDVGRFVLELTPFDWDVASGRAIPVSAETLPALRWRLHEPDPADLDSPGQPMSGVVTVEVARGHQIDAHGGKAFLVVTGRGRGDERCSPSVVPLRQLPGYVQRYGAETVLQMRVPTCQATRAGMILIPAGAFIHGGVGEPPSELQAQQKDDPPERVLDLPAFWVDRTEVSNAAFAPYADMEGITGVLTPTYPTTADLGAAGGATWPVTNLTWIEARGYCRFLGKELPTTEQWGKAMRGGLVLPDGRTNPMPRRNLPWGTPVAPVPAKLRDTGAPGPAAVGTFAGDVSPYGVMDLAGNVQEWTDSAAVSTPTVARWYRISRGANWDDARSADLVDYMAISNSRIIDTRGFAQGMRCAAREP